MEGMIGCGFYRRRSKRGVLSAVDAKVGDVGGGGEGVRGAEGLVGTLRGCERGKGDLKKKSLSFLLFLWWREGF